MVLEYVYRDVLEQIKAWSPLTRNKDGYVQGTHDYAARTASGSLVTYNNKLAYIIYACCHLDGIMNIISVQTRPSLFKAVFLPEKKPHMYRLALMTISGGGPESYSPAMLVYEFLARVSSHSSYHYLPISIADKGDQSCVGITPATRINGYEEVIIG